MDDINTSVETQEVAETAYDVADESAENLEVAEPETEETNSTEESTEGTSGKTPADSAFAEQRRRIRELEETNAQKEAENKEMFEALSRFFNGESAEELSINANAYAEQRDPDEYRAEYEHKKEFDSLKAENETLNDELLNIQVEALMREGLKEIQSIDPSVKSLDELGETFAHFIGAGLTTKEAYYAAKARDANEKVYAPDAIGKVADTRAERDYYTSDELDHLSDEELDANWDKVMRSMNRLSK